jgi:hypothetical protein
MSFTEAEELVKCQAVRCKHIQQRVSVKVERDIQRAKHAQTGVQQQFHGGAYGLMVYDMETVENVRGLQHKVWEPFQQKFSWHEYSTAIQNEFHGNMEALRRVEKEMFALVEAQIPYCVQWGLVRAVGGETPIYRDWARIEWGNNKLGKCVDDFFRNAATLCYSFGIQTCYAYAHNGARFDALLMKTYIKEHKIKDVLITPRGILSMKVIVTVPGQTNKKVTFILRDTMAFFGQSLSTLCQVFGVPERFSKTDFPITKVNMRNYDNAELRKMLMPYVQNDVFALSFIVRAIDRILTTVVHEHEDPHPMSLEGAAGQNVQTSGFRLYFKPAIARFMTLMSVVKFQQKHLFYENGILSTLSPIDLPVLRNVVNYANVGGRVQAFWRSYTSKYAAQLLRDFAIHGNDGDMTERRALYAMMCAGKNYKKVLDVTSLYPYVMESYPMPTGNVRYVDDEFCEQVLAALDCSWCLRGGKKCERHSCGGEDDLIKLGFVIMLITNVAPPPKESASLMNICPRKTVDRNGPSGLLYSWETDKAYAERMGGKKRLPMSQAYSMYDVYWLKKCGWSFIILNGMQFECSYVFRPFIQKMYVRRNEAKEREKREGLPKCESTFWKNDYNGHYGVQCQKDIHERYIVAEEKTQRGMPVVVDIENEMADEDVSAFQAATTRARLPHPDSFEKALRASRVAPDEEIVRTTHTHKMNNGQWLIRLRKCKNAFSEYADQSPNQIGAAVTSGARHHMNLLLFEHFDKCGYTDTDSLSCLGGLCETLETEERYRGIIDESATPVLGTYKNDHEAPGEKVFMSFYLGKKIKLHVTVDESMKIRFHSTFKGYNPSKLNRLGDEIRSEAVQYMRIFALGEMFYRGAVTGLRQTEFERDISRGVIIDKDSAFSTSLESAFGHHDGVIFETLENGDLVERLVPKGKIEPGKEPTFPMPSPNAVGFSFMDKDDPKQVNRSTDRLEYYWENGGIRYHLFCSAIKRLVMDTYEGPVEPETLITAEAADWSRQFKEKGIPDLLPQDFVWPDA